ncbi:MAG TPA: hypothetical protein VD948_00390 [Rhodothermales bacterium]|nr:hypothetical protein [Rhodothermales bacterium]
MLCRYALLLLLLLAPAALTAQVPRPSAYGLERAVLETALLDLWPGFDVRRIPLAVFDGRQTVLFRHPAPPEGFRQAVDGAVWTGRYPAVIANTRVDLGGTTTATVLLSLLAPRTPAPEAAAVAVHEAFHVFQRQRHPGWQANELDLFTYPDEDPAVFALAERERRALHRALQTPYREAACHARQALALRAERYARLDVAHATYERKNELNEGLPAYVQARAAHHTPADVARAPFTADVRDRAYHTGPALAFLLDRFAPGWRPVLDARDSLALDRMLVEALPEATGCAAPAADAVEAERLARTSIAGLQGERTRRFAAFEGQRGTRLVIEAAAGKPLWPQNFDPYNLVRSGARVLHTRTVQVGNDAGALTVFDRTALTEGAGAHPLFNGIGRVVVAGLARPMVTRDGDAVVVRAAGVVARFTGAEVRERPGEVVVTLR